MCRLLSYGFLCAGVGLLGLAAYFYFAPAPGPNLEVGEAEIEVRDCPAKADTPVMFRLHNRSGRPMRVLGVGTC
jgi:hypothetical protein